MFTFVCDLLVFMTHLKQELRRHFSHFKRIYVNIISLYKFTLGCFLLSWRWENESRIFTSFWCQLITARIPEKSMFVLFKRQTSGKTLFTYFETLHIKRLKFRSQTLVKSLFGITGQTMLLLTVVLSHGPQNVGSFHCNCLPLEPAGQRQTV